MSGGRGKDDPKGDEALLEQLRSSPMIDTVPVGQITGPFQYPRQPIFRTVDVTFDGGRSAEVARAEVRCWTADEPTLVQVLVTSSHGRHLTWIEAAAVHPQS